MAFQAQMNFIKFRFPHELAFMPDTSQFIAKSYDSCSDPRSWSLDKTERSQYYLELLSAPTEHEVVDIEEGGQPERVRRPRGERGEGVQITGAPNELETKNQEIDDLKRKLKELEDRLKAGAGESGSGAKDGDQEKGHDDCLKELERLKKELQTKNDELENARKEVEKIKADAAANKQIGKSKDDNKKEEASKSDPKSSSASRPSSATTDDCAKLREENEKLKKDLGEANGRADDLKNKLEAATKAASACDPAELERLRAENEKLNKNLNEVVDKLEKATKGAGKGSGPSSDRAAEPGGGQSSDKGAVQDGQNVPGSGKGSGAGLGPSSGTETGPGSGSGSGTGPGTGSSPGAGSDIGRGQGTDSDPGAGIGSDSGPGSGAGSGPGAGSGSPGLGGAGSGADQRVDPAAGLGGDASPAQLNDQLRASQALNNKLNQDLEDLRRQLMECNKAREASRRNDPDSGNESDRGGRSDRSEDCDAIRRERDCLRSKFCQLEPELLCLSNMVRDFECLEDRYCQLRGELEERETREIALMNRLQLLMQMESEFYALQRRVCESENLLKQYQANNSIGFNPQNVTDSGTVETSPPVNVPTIEGSNAVQGEKSQPNPSAANGKNATNSRKPPKEKKSSSGKGATTSQPATKTQAGMKCQAATQCQTATQCQAATQCQVPDNGKCGAPFDELLQTTQATVIAVRCNLQSTNDEKNLAKKLYFGLRNLVKSYEQNYCKFQCGDDDEYDDECNWCSLDYLIVANDEFVKLKLIRECETSNCNKSSVCALQLKIFNLTSCISDLNDIVENQKNDLALARCEIGGLEDQIRVLRKNIEIERNEYDNINSQQKVKQLECQLKSKTCELEKLQGHMKTMESNMCRITTQFKELENNLANARTANNVLKQNFKELDENFCCQKSEMSNKTVELLQLKKKYECLCWDNKILTENINCLAEKLRDNDNSMNCSAIQMNDKLNQLMCENQKLKNEVSILNDNLNEINCLLSAYECEKHREVDLVKVLDNIDTSLTQLNQPCCGEELDVPGECRDIYENLNNTIQKLIKQLEIEQMKSCNLEKQINRMRKDLECQPDASDCQKKIFELQAKLQLYDATNYEKILQIENLKREVKFLSGPTDDIKSDNQKLLKCVDELKMELKYAMARIEAFEKCELLSERDGTLCERSSQTDTKEPAFDLTKLKSLYEKEVNNISKSHCDGLRTLQSLHEMQTCDLRRDHESEIQQLRSQIEMLRAHITKLVRGETTSDRPKTCVCACNGVPPLKKDVANKIEVICKRILNCGIDKLTFDELCYIHEQIYTAALRLQNVNETGRATLKKQRSQLENRIKYIEKELKKFRNLLEKLKELQKQKRKLLNSAPPNSRSGTKISGCHA